MWSPGTTGPKLARGKVGFWGRPPRDSEEKAARSPRFGAVQVQEMPQRPSRFQANKTGSTSRQ